MNPLAGLTMYDALTMLTSGFLWCIMFSPIRYYCCCDSHWSREILFSVICYVVGLIWHRGLDGLAFRLDFLRDNTCLMQKSRYMVLKRWSKNFWQKSQKKNWRKNWKKSQEENWKKSQGDNRKRSREENLKNDWKRLREQLIIKNYYDAYYRLAEHKSLGSIPVLEAQAAFIRDIVPILGLYLIGVFWGEFGIYKNMDRFLFTRYEVGVFLGGAILLLVVARFVSQYKIYELVWEGDYYTGGNSNNSKVKNEGTLQG